MRLELTDNKKVIEYACRYFHYARKRPAIITKAYSVFNDKNEWCGVITFGLGANYNLGKEYKLYNGEMLELKSISG